MSSSYTNRNSGLQNSSESSITAQTGKHVSQVSPLTELEDSTSSVNPEINNLLPNVGVHGPIMDNFDFEGRINLPDAITQFELPLAVHICKNIAIEEFNNSSILKTIAVKNSPMPRPCDMDIGPPLKPLYYYVDNEIHDLIDSEALCVEQGPVMEGTE
ncbi:hypothetical protein C0993_004263 [Termitomyces sp. T159_Od127]|nr:hypothetical protein C0993_004263 [Termitomyces sp. T159_Od127]